MTSARTQAAVSTALPRVVAAARPIVTCFAVGAGSMPAVAAFGEGAQWYASTDALLEALLPDLHRGLTLYVKGSRVNRLERVTAALAPDADRGAH